jgi:hypothetical protein
MHRVNGVKDIVAFKTGLRRGTGKRGLAGLAVLGAMGIAGLVGGWGASPVEPSEISAADVVALRFPDDWNDDGAAAAAPPATFALASATVPQQLESSMLFSPYQTYSVQSYSVQSAASVPVAVVEAPAAPPNVVPEMVSAPKPAAAPVRVATPASTPRPVPAPRARKDSGALFNDAQLASIRNRLKLTEYQQQYWPPVESALRDIGWRARQAAAHKSEPHGSPTRLAEIDPNSDEVQRLKSAAFPLIMSMNDEQKHEVRTLAMVMGLQQVASSF